MATKKDDKKDPKKKAPPKGKDPKDAPLGKGLAERAKQTLLDRQRKIREQVEGV